MTCILFACADTSGLTSEGAPDAGDDVAPDAGTRPDGDHTPDAGLDAPIDSANDVAYDAATDAAADAGSDAASCNALSNTAPLISVLQVPATLPAALGGALVEGRYYVTTDVEYTGPDGGSGLTGQADRFTLEIVGDPMDAGTFQWVRELDGGDVSSSFALVVSGSSFTLTPTCGPHPGGTFGYTVADGGFSVYAARREYVFTRQ